MTRESVQSLREQIQLARFASNHLGEDVANLDHLLHLPDADLADAITLDDMIDIWLNVPAYFRRAAS